MSRNLKFSWTPSNDTDVTVQELALSRTRNGASAQNWGPFKLSKDVKEFGIGPDYQITPENYDVQAGDVVQVTLVARKPSGRSSHPQRFEMKVPESRPAAPTGIACEAD